MKADGKIVVASAALGKGSNDLLKPFVGKALVARGRRRWRQTRRRWPGIARTSSGVRPDDPQGDELDVHQPWLLGRFVGALDRGWHDKLKVFCFHLVGLVFAVPGLKGEGCSREMREASDRT